MKNNKLVRILIGIGAGVLGVILTRYSIHIPATDSFADLRDMPPVICALFLGPLCGIVAGATASIGRALMPVIYGIGGGTWVASSLATFSATLFAMACRRWIFLGKRPPAIGAMLFGAIAEVVHMMVILVFGFGDLTSTIVVIREAVLVQCIGVAVCAGIASLLFNFRQSISSNLSWLVCSLACAGVLFGVFVAQTATKLTVATNTAETSEADALANIDFMIEPELLRMAKDLGIDWGTIECAATQDLHAVAMRKRVDLIEVVDTNGIVLASSNPDAVGKSIADGVDKITDEEMLEYVPEDIDKFLECVKDSKVNYQIALFRTSLNSDDDETLPKSERYRKYVMHVFPDGRGAVQIADAVHSFDQRGYVFERCMQEWHIGESGYMLLVDKNTGRIFSGLCSDWIGININDTGLAGLSDKPERQLLEATTILNNDESADEPMLESPMPVFVWRTELSYADVDTYLIFPRNDVMFVRDQSVLVASIVLLLLFVVATMLFIKIVGQSNNLKAFYQKEEQRRHRDLEWAKDIQVSALPTIIPATPESPEIDIYATMRTAKEVGGDFYDFCNLDSRHMLLVVADVSDKGIPAAMFMMKAKSVIRGAVSLHSDLADAVRDANDNLCENNTSGMFVTAWIGIIDRETGTIEYVSAGHNPPYIRRKDGKVEVLTAPRALVLGSIDGVSYRKSVTRLVLGDTILLYTDGITEACNANDELYGEQRLLEDMAKCDSDARDTCKRIEDFVDAFVNGAPQSDDMTIFAVRYIGPAMIRTRTFPATTEGLGDATEFLSVVLGAEKEVDAVKSSVLIAFDEIGSNIVRYSGASDFTIRIEFIAGSDSVRIDFSDAGRPYNPFDRADPDITLSADDRAIGGLGFFMVKKMMDDVKYVRDSGRNVLTIVKKLPRES